MNSESEDESSISPNLFLAPRLVEMTHSIIGADWDDTQLIKAYDKAISPIKRELLKRIQVKLDLTESDLQEAFSDVSIDNKKKKKRKKNKTAEPLNDASITEKEKKKTKKYKASTNLLCEWKIGDICRAIYHEDNQEYEAEIVSIVDSQRCRIRFLGYENEQEDLMQNLMPSLGENVIELQLEAAAAYNDAMDSEEYTMESELEGSSQPESVKLKFSNFKADTTQKTNQDRFQPPPFFTNLHNPFFNQDYHPFPPVPPMPPCDFSYFKHNASQYLPRNGLPAQSIKSDDLHHMLFSWYMCGYYTGYFERGSTKN